MTTKTGNPTPPDRPTVFLSYSRKDKRWLEELRTMLAPLVRSGIVDVWWDGDIKPSQKWREEIDGALAAARIGVLLVSPNFLASDFINQKELPYLIEAAELRGVTLFWVLLSECLYEQTPLGEIQAAHDISRPLDLLERPRRGMVLKAICQKIAKAAGASLEGAGIKPEVSTPEKSATRSTTSTEETTASARMEEVPSSGETLQEGSAGRRSYLRKSGRRSRLAVYTALAATLAFGGYLGLREPARPPPVRLAFTQLTDLEGREFYPTIAPDGNSFVFARSLGGQMDLFLKKIGSDAPINITAGSPDDDTQPAISPDGLWIAFRSERDGGGIYVISLNGGPVRRISDFGYNPSWSPDGRELAVATAGIIDPAIRTDESRIWVVDVVTGRRRLLFQGDGVQPNWSPHGGRIAFWGIPAGGARRVLWTVPVIGGEPRKILDDGYLNWNPIWSSDGKHLYFGSDHSGSLNLWRLPINETTGEVLGEPEPLTTPSTESGFWSVSGDGRRIVYAANESRSNVERLPFDSGRVRVMGPGVAVTRGSQRVASCDISPDRRWVAFHGMRPWDDLFLVRADGSDLKQLTEDRYKDRTPFWSPDGRRLLFYSNRNGVYEAWILGVDDRKWEPVLPAGRKRVTFPFWSPDGRRVACTYNGQAAVIDLEEPLASRRAQPLPPAGTIGEAFYPASWSAEGEFLAGNISRLDGSLLEGIGVYSFRMRTYERLTSRGANPVWLRDGRRLLYLESGKIVAFDTRTHKEWEVLAPPSNSAYTFVSPAERSLFAVRAVEEGDIWLLTLGEEKERS